MYVSDIIKKIERERERERERDSVDSEEWTLFYLQSKENMGLVVRVFLARTQTLTHTSY